MKKLHTLASSLLLAAALAAPAAVMAHAEHGQPQYGGIFAEAGEAQLELVNQAGKVALHVTQHGAPVPVQGGKARLTVLEGGAKRELQLAPAAENRLEAAASLKPGAKVVAAVELPGRKPLQARFEVK